MELLSCDNTSVLVGAAVILAAYALWRKQHKQSNYPNGPFSFPLLGNLPQIILSKSIEKFLKQCRHRFGNIFTVELGGSKRVVVSGYQNIYNLLVKNGDVTSNRSISFFAPHYVEMAKKTPGLVYAPYPHWKTIRSFSLNVMREEGMGKQIMEPKITDEISLFCNHYIEPHCGQPVELSKGLIKATCNVISGLIFGGRNEYDDPHFDFLVKTVDTEFKVALKSAILKNIPFMHFFKFSGLKDASDATGVFLPEMRSRLVSHRSDLDPDNPRDIFDAFLAVQTEDENDNSAFSDGNGAVMATQLYQAGTETTSTALGWALLYSCLHPDVKTRVVGEIDREIGRERPVSYKDRTKLPYTEAVLLETLRLADIAPNALPHTLEKSLEVDGVVIPAGADLMLNMTSVLHDDEVFEEPLMFKPERYMTGDVALKKQRTIPFGIGRRNCLGESLARMEFLMFYVTLLQRYDIKLAPNNLNASTKPISGIVNQPQPYELQFNRRH